MVSLLNAADDWIVRPIGLLVVCLLLIWLVCQVYLWIRDYHRRRPAYIKDRTDAREYMAVDVMLSRHVRTVHLPGMWLCFVRPLYTAASDADEWERHRRRALFALADIRRDIERENEEEEEQR